MIPHVQFRRVAGERPYPFSLNLNPVTPTFYVRRPDWVKKDVILDAFDGAHVLNKEIKIPVPDAAVAERVAAEFL